MDYSVLDVVVLNCDIPEEGLFSGMKGTIVDSYEFPHKAYEVEFCDSNGYTIALLALAPEQIKRTSTTSD